MRIVGRGEAAADVEDFDFWYGRGHALPGRCRRPVGGLDVVGEIRALAADVETQALDDQSRLEGDSIRSTASPEPAPNFEENSTTDPVLGTSIRSTRPACGAYFLILAISSLVVVGHQRLVGSSSTKVC